MNAFDIRLQNNLFPDMPPSFSDSVHQALRKAGVQRKVTRAPWIAATAVTALASAAAFVLILSNAFSGRTASGVEHEDSFRIRGGSQRRGL